MPRYDTSICERPMTVFSAVSVASNAQQPNVRDTVTTMSSGGDSKTTVHDSQPSHATTVRIANDKSRVVAFGREKAYIPNSDSKPSQRPGKGHDQYAHFTAEPKDSDQAPIERPTRSALRPRRREILKDQACQDRDPKANNGFEGSRARSNSEKPRPGRAQCPSDTRVPAREASGHVEPSSTVQDEPYGRRVNSHSTCRDMGAPRSSSLQPQRRSPFPTPALPTSPRPTAHGFSSTPLLSDHAVFSSSAVQVSRRHPFENHQQHQREQEQDEQDFGFRRLSEGTSSDISYQTDETSLYTPLTPLYSPSFLQTQNKVSQASNASASAPASIDTLLQQEKANFSKKPSKLKSKLANFFMKDEETIMEDSTQVQVKHWTGEDW